MSKEPGGDDPFRGPPGGAARENPAGSEAVDEEDGWFVCKACGRKIARLADRMADGDGGKRTCANPHGLVFTILLFRAAPGCMTAGAAQSAFTWFPGHCWRVALCAGCLAHLGWRYEGGSLFFGLIEGALRETG